jgi:hypothetical protein
VCIKNEVYKKASNICSVNLLLRAYKEKSRVWKIKCWCGGAYEMRLNKCTSAAGGEIIIIFAFYATTQICTFYMRREFVTEMRLGTRERDQMNLIRCGFQISCMYRSFKSSLKPTRRSRQHNKSVKNNLSSITFYMA